MSLPPRGRGPPKGNTNGAKDRTWGRAIQEALNRRIADGRMAGLYSLADKLIEEAWNGSIPAYVEIGNRLDGRAHQQVTVSGDPGNPLHAAISLTDQLAAKLNVGIAIHTAGSVAIGLEQVGAQVRQLGSDEAPEPD